MRRIGKWTAVGLVGLAALLLVVVVVVHAAWNHEKTAQTITAWASKTLSGRGPSGDALVIRRVDWPLGGALRSLLGGSPVRVDVWDFVIWDVDGKEVLRSSHVNVGVQLTASCARSSWATCRSRGPISSFTSSTPSSTT